MYSDNVPVQTSWGEFISSAFGPVMSDEFNDGVVDFPSDQPLKPLGGMWELSQRI